MFLMVKLNTSITILWLTNICKFLHELLTSIKCHNHKTNKDFGFKLKHRKALPICSRTQSMKTKSLENICLCPGLLCVHTSTYKNSCGGSKFMKFNIYEFMYLNTQTHSTHPFIHPNKTFPKNKYLKCKTQLTNKQLLQWQQIRFYKRTNAWLTTGDECK